MHWQHKALAFRAFGALPGGKHVHYVTQRYVTKRFPRPPARIQAFYNGSTLAHVDATARLSTAGRVVPRASELTNGSSAAPLGRPFLMA
jgi:hypothetical protein